MRAVLVCVDFGDLLNLTLAYNRHHFTEVMVVTTPEDGETLRVVNRNNAIAHCTYSFYENGEYFNKWRALEEALDSFGRQGLMCIMDVDILLPAYIDKSKFRFGNLYSPPRRILNDISSVPSEGRWFTQKIRNEKKGFGYTQIFYGSDPVLQALPWFPSHWKHAGGADALFQERWPERNKIRTPWEVLHLGSIGQNWCGRIQPRLDGKAIPDLETRKQHLLRVKRKRITDKNRYYQGLV